MRRKMLIIKKALRTGFATVAKTSPVIASKLIYYKTFKKRLNLKNPKTFNEKLMWLKLNEDDSLKAKCTDKYLVRDYMSKLGYSNLLVDLYKVYECVEDINFQELPNRFVMKCTHGSGFNIICTDKDKLDKDQAKHRLKRWMKTDYSLISCEPHYAKIKPRIIVERFLEESDRDAPIDYKFHCFQGKPQVIETVLDRWIPEKKDMMFNCNWELLPYNNDSVNFQKIIKKPERLNEMLEIAKNLSEAFTYVRVDLYYCNNEIYLGELTFTPAACLDTDFINDSDYKMGKLLDLTKLSNKSSCNVFYQDQR